MNITLPKTWWYTISNRHVHENMDKLQVVRIRLMNQYAFLISLIFIIDALRNLWLGRDLNFWVLFGLGALLFLLSQSTKVYFNMKIAVSILMAATLILFYFCSAAGFQNGIAPYYFAILFAALFIFNEKSNLYNIFVFLWVFVFFYITQLYDWEWLNGINTKQIYLHKSQQAMFIQLMILLAFNGYFIMLKNNEIQKLYHRVLHSDTETVGTNNIEQQADPMTVTVSPLLTDVMKLAQEDDLAFLPIFKEVFPNFYDNLLRQNPTMTKEEFKFCALLKLGFTTKDIARYTHLTVRSVQTKKNRLRKSFQIQQQEDLYSWIERF